MLRQQAALLRKIGIVLDLGMIALGFSLAYGTYSHLLAPTATLGHYLWLPLLAAPVWFFFFQRYNLYASIRRVTVFEIATRVINTHLFGGIILAALVYLLNPGDPFNRGLLLSFLGFSLLLLLTEKVGLRLVLGRLRAKGYNTRHLVVVGTREKARRFQKLLEEHRDWGLVVAGFVQVGSDPPLEEVNGHRVLGREKDLIAICKNSTVDEVVFCLPNDRARDAEGYLQELEELGITSRMVLDSYHLQHFARELSLFNDELPILTFHSRSLDAQQLFLKRLLDLAGALAGLTLLAALLPFIALAIRIDSPGPIFFGQDRVGQNGRIFKCWKFRSMYLDAEERKKELLTRNEMKGAIFKIKDDPRITPVGRFLRKTSLDELPQFWNVLQGQMSLVGTRPPTPDEVEQYENWQRRRISIKPGITGKWQVSGRNAIEDFDEIVRLDLDYIDNWSLWLDVKILFKTLVVVFGRKGSF